MARRPVNKTREEPITSRKLISFLHSPDLVRLTNYTMPLAETLQRRIKPLKYDGDDEVGAASLSPLLISDEHSSANEIEDASTASTDKLESEAVR